MSPRETLQTTLQAAILDLLAQRTVGKTICPSEVARSVAGSDERNRWEPLMESIRQAAHALAQAGKITVTQRGHAVNITTAKGPVRLRLR